MNINKAILFLVFCFGFSTQTGIAQIINLPCQTQTNAFVGLDRNNWNSGSTALHSEGLLHNFTLPANTFGQCKKIEQIEVLVDYILTDESGLPAGCGVFNYFTNLYVGCSDFNPASCFIFDQVGQNPANDQTLTYTCPPFQFDFGDVFGVDIVPAMDPPSCSVFQTALSSGSLVVEYEICVNVTIGNEMIDVPVDLGTDQTVCGTETTLLDAGSYSQYSWLPNNESSQTINATGSPSGTAYQVTVTDANGCTDTDEIIVTSSMPSVTIDENDPDNTICPGETIILTANTTESNILWSTNQSSSSISVGPGPYSVVVTDANNCTAMANIQIDEYPSSTVNLIADMTTVCGTDQTTITATTGFIDYDWDNGDSGNIIVVGVGTYTVVATDINGCEATETIQIFSATPPNAGTATNMVVCNDGSTYNVDGNLGVHDFGGDWADLDATGIDINIDPFNVSFAGVAPGFYNFSYTVFGTAPCGDDDETITIEVVQGADAGTSNNITICSDDPPVNFYSEISTADQSGFWTDINGSGADLSDPSSVDFSNVMNGTYVFNYEVLATAPCNSAMATLTIIVDAAAEAGMDVMVSICEGAQYDLFDALDVFADIGGTFMDDSNTSALTGSIFNTAGFAGQTVMFTYSVGSVNCGNDQAVVTVEVVSSVSAGDNSTGNVFCVGDIIDLFDVLTNEDAGGVFTDLSSSGALNGNIFDTQISGSGMFTITYEVGDNIICPLETAQIDLVIIEAPTINMQGNFDLCPDECAELSISIDGQDPLMYDLTAFEAPNIASLSYNGSGNSGQVSVWLCNGAQASVSNDTIFLAPNPISWMLIPNSISNNQCTNQAVNTDTVFVNTFESYNIIVDDAICAGDSVIVGNEIFNEMNPSGVVTLSSIQGCDSIVEVNLDILDVGKLIYDNTLCSGDDIMIGGIVFDEDNPSDTLILMGASASGCDSIIEIDLSFVQSFNTEDEIFICQGDSVFIDNVWVKNEGNYINNLISAQQCDSIVDVTLTFFPPAESLLDPVLCEGGMIIVNGTVYDEDNRTGVETLENASANGCDSIVTINLSFSDEIVVDLTREICKGDSVLVDGVWYFDNAMITEMEVSGSGCDSTTNTTVFVFPESIFNFTQELCSDGSVIVNGTVYDMANPMGMETIPNADQYGCDSTVNVLLSFVNEIMETDDANICEGDSIFLAGAWQFDAGQYSDTFTSSNGCDSTVTTTLTVDACFSLGTVTIIDNVCAGDANGSICVTVDSGSIPLLLRWENTDSGETGNIMITSTGNQFCESSLLSGNYTLEYFDNSGILLATENYSIQDLNTPLVGNIVVTNPLNCFGIDDAILEVDVSGGSGSYTYAWNQNLGNQSTVNNIGAGNYEVVVMDAEQCALNLDITIAEPQEMSFTVETSNSTCLNVNNGSINISNINPFTSDFSISVNGADLESPYELNDLGPGSYELVLTNDLNCTLINTVQIDNIGSDILTDFTDTYQIELKDSVEFVASYPTSIDSVIWSPADDFISCTNCLFPVFSPETSTSYLMTVFNESGCTEQHTININVRIPEVDVFVPNVFSPNGDGMNDVFILGFSDLVTEPYTLSIFDRWGNRVYDKDLEPNSQEGWDGSYNQSRVVPGVYMYMVRYIDPNRGEIIISGDITVF